MKRKGPRTGRELKEAHDAGEVTQRIQTYVSRYAEIEVLRRARAAKCSVAQYVRTVLMRDLFPKE